MLWTRATDSNFSFDATQRQFHGKGPRFAVQAQLPSLAAMPDTQSKGCNVNAAIVFSNIFTTSSSWSILHPPLLLLQPANTSKCLVGRLRPRFWLWGSLWGPLAPAPAAESASRKLPDAWPAAKWVISFWTMHSCKPLMAVSLENAAPRILLVDKATSSPTSYPFICFDQWKRHLCSASMICWKRALYVTEKCPKISNFKTSLPTNKVYQKYWFGWCLV